MLRNVFTISQESNIGKLTSNKEGPYWIFKITRKELYKLEEMDAKPVKVNRNMEHLKRFYF